MNKVQLYNKVTMPLLGFGVFQITDSKECEMSVLHALQTGYRMIDTAACYGNERAVGNAVKKSGIQRNEIFLVSKVWIQDAGYESTKTSFYKTLENLQTEYLDLYLIHMPLGDYHGSWKAMEELYKEGKIKAIGVCNFGMDRLMDLILTHEIKPMINQIELHPFTQQKKLLEFMNKYAIQPMAWAPFAEGKNNIFQNDLLVEIGKCHKKTSAQVILNWLLSSNIIAIPKSVHSERIQENFNIFDFSLSQKELTQIKQMDTDNPLILDINSVEEVLRLHDIRFIQ